ncbi:MAG: adenylate/guanylate cyclase domain-containing protein [Gallionella sp.]
MTEHLSGDIKRSLLMVDGKATFGEISKRAAPSLRSSLEQMFKELVQDGFIQEKIDTSNAPRMGVPPKMAVPSRMVVPHKMASPVKKPVADEGDNELDFSSVAQTHSHEASPAESVKANDEAEAEAIAYSVALAKAEDAEAKARAEAEARARARAQAESKPVSKARQETDAESRAAIEIEARALEEARARAEAEALDRANDKANDKQEAYSEERALEVARSRVEAEAKARAAAEAKAMAEAKARAEAEAKVMAEAKARAEAEAKAMAEAIARAEAEARAMAEAKARAEAEAKARAEAEAKARAEAEARAAAEARIRAEAEAQARAVAEANAKQEAKVKTNAEQESEVAGLKSRGFQVSRTTIATVLFFDVVGYTKLPVNKQIEVKKQFNRLVSVCLKKLGNGERIILDTGDGAAIGFMQHPDEALKVAMQFRNAVIANQHNDYPELKTRIGIHLGPISVVKDINGLSNMVGDGINDAQRVMSFAESDQIYISRPYYDFISRLSSEYASLFQYQGSLPDKHGREHPVYKMEDVATTVSGGELSKTGSAASGVKLEPFSFNIPESTLPSAPTSARSGVGLHKDDAALMNEIGNFAQFEGVKKPAAAKPAAQSQIPPAQPVTEQLPDKLPTWEVVQSEDEESKPSAHEVKKVEEAQAKVWAEAEQRAKEAATAKAKAVWDADLPPEPQAVAKKAAPVARVKRKPLPWFKLGFGLIVLALIILFVAPFVMPTREYVPAIQKLLGGKLHQPVYIGRLQGRLLPTPRLDLIDMSIGDKKQIKAGLVRLNFAILPLLTEIKSIESVELEKVQVNAAALEQVSVWLQQTAADAEYPIASILLHEGKLEMEGFELSGIGGEVNFDQAGKFSVAKLHAEGSKYAVELEAAPLYKTRVTIALRGSALPLLPSWVFDDLTAKGELTGNELVISELDSRILGGSLLGNARINWRSGWRAQGSLVAKTITMQNMLKVMSGDMGGTARFQMQAASLGKLTDAATLDGSFVIKNGVINGIDIGETARLHRTENMPGGRTHFDELSGDLSYAKDAFAFRQLKMIAGVLMAKGALDYSGQQAAGTITANLAMPEGMAPVALVLGGTRDNPTLRAVR